MLDIAGGDQQLFRELTAIIVRSIPQYIATLARAFEQADADAIKAALHKIKGTLQMVGADQTLKRMSHLHDDIKINNRLPTPDAGLGLLEELHAIANEVSAYSTPAQD